MLHMHASEQLNPMVQSSHISVVPVECADTASSALLWREVEACNSGSECKVTADLPVELFPRKPSLLPFLGKEYSRFHERINQPSIFPHIPNVELSSDGVSCHSLKPYDLQFDETQLDKFEVHFSDVCERRFVMFDHSGSKRRMIFHPSTVHEFPGLFRTPLKRTYCEELTQLESTKDVGHLKDTLVTSLASDDCASLDAILPPGWRSTLWKCGEEVAFPALFGTDGEACCLGGLSDRLPKENSEELDALLWSDDEMSSTGHSPSGLTLSDADDSHSLNAIYSRARGTSCCMKRKASLEAETESTATSGISTRKEVFFRDSEDLGRGSGYGIEGLTVYDLSSASEESFGGSSDSQRQHESRISTYRPSVKKIRKDKIQSTLQFLRSIIPGGESMEAALVLSEAVQYVKNLQVQVEQLEGNVSRNL